MEDARYLQNPVNHSLIQSVNQANDFANQSHDSHRESTKHDLAIRATSTDTNSQRVTFHSLVS